MESLCEKMMLHGGGVISLVGAGGKTTIMFRLAHEFARRGESVLTTTSTKILMPSNDQSRKTIVSPSASDIVKQSREYLRNHRHLTAGSGYFPSHKKLKGFDSDGIEALWQNRLFNWIVVEADGAARKPLKAPTFHEPVIPACSHWLIAVVGLDAIGKPLLEEWVFRSQIYSDLTGLPLGEAITECSVARILTDKNGIMKGCPSHTFRYVFLNKADVPFRRTAGHNIVNSLRKMTGNRPDSVILGSAGRPSLDFEYYSLTHNVTQVDRLKVEG